jgi:hypothetical protein
MSIHLTQDPCFSPCREDLTLEPSFQFDAAKEGKSANSRFFLLRSAPSLFFSFVFFAFPRSFFALRSQARKHEKIAASHLCRTIFGAASISAREFTS